MHRNGSQSVKRVEKTSSDNKTEKTAKSDVFLFTKIKAVEDFVNEH